MVDVEITDWPSPTQNPRGRVIEVLGREDDFGVDVEITIRKFHLPHHFPEAALREAQDTLAVIPAREVERRRDFRGLPIVTIDGETARDFDDAVYVHMLPNGNFELQVHIADVAQYVTRTQRSIRKRDCAAPVSTFPTVRCPCSRWNFPPIFAVCVRRWNDWCFRA